MTQNFSIDPEALTPIEDPTEGQTRTTWQLQWIYRNFTRQDAANLSGCLESSGAANFTVDDGIYRAQPLPKGFVLELFAIVQTNNQGRFLHGFLSYRRNITSCSGYENVTWLGDYVETGGLSSVDAKAAQWLVAPIVGGILVLGFLGTLVARWWPRGPENKDDDDDDDEAVRSK
eukprot:CAMPEP_0184683326 /NCGR_PEP_ID=MMETSP0312-20130426/10814_1 /TAXON_ID=31354 /ORGANISM="Compsopogon coeruleus, Strain SAG 36.94" /LENGTH=173 /DNA_ID=CAMNT_0027135585 /DNA_START=218 /DNA_END=739 /DNA_ORIENTATION=-